MARPIVDFPDAILATLGVLRARVASATFGTKAPEEYPTAPAAPYVAVAVDSSTVRYPVTETVSLRLAVWGVDDASGYALARHLRAVLLAYEGGPEVRSYGPLTGPIPTTDPATGSPLSTFTVAARLRPTIY
ncbi:hypothetical protein [Actinopolymorpha pittospori]|uniref:Tail terminator n=1 Tax=Actinopolymorpha pittospori TaxID=648752 RepID=A0A927MST1_9ACTN|nr:hypothetical protein [Actinopolymorpha pittospori]MBE1606246.1 hypothetical protein [Actinopolymorpha pittospori]